MKRSGSRSEGTALALIDATLQIVRESGVKSVTHRKVCSLAGVALGSSTYHYENLDTLVQDAFTHYVNNVSAKYEAHFSGVTSDKDLIEAVLQVTSILTVDAGNAILEWELLAAAGREQAYLELAQEWSRHARLAVETYVSSRTAHMLEVIWDGATVQRVLNGTQLTDAELRMLIRAALELDSSRHYPQAQPGSAAKKPPAKAAAKKPPAKAAKAASSPARRRIKAS